ncbi:MAG: PqqD family protein [Proteobacteria bacterium]|nr:PqqD family protein [Pseudomonadota bacterium]
MRKPDKKPGLAPARGVVARTIAGETLLVPIRGDLADMQRIFSVSPVAAFIWERLDGKMTCQDLAREVSEEFEVSLEEALPDVEAFAQRLVSAGLARNGD